MYRATGGGTRSSMGCRAASRARTVLDDTSRVCASTRKIDVPVARGVSSGRRIRVGRSDARATALSSVASGRAITTNCAASSTAGNSRQVAISANASLPRMKKSCDASQPSAASARRVSTVGRPRASAPCPMREALRHPGSPAPRARSDERERPVDPQAGAAGRTRDQAHLVQHHRAAALRGRYRGARDEWGRTCRRECQAGPTRSCVVSAARA